MGHSMRGAASAEYVGSASTERRVEPPKEGGILFGGQSVQDVIPPRVRYDRLTKLDVHKVDCSLVGVPPSVVRERLFCPPALPS